MSEDAIKKKHKTTAEKELDRLQEEFDQFNDQVKSLSQDVSSLPKPKEVEPQTKLSAADVEKMGEIWLKPVKTVASFQKFNERFRDEYNYRKEYVCFIAENKEIIGEKIEKWTRPYGGMSAEFWEVPVNRPVWGPRYLAEEISQCKYNRLKTDNNIQMGSNGAGTMYGGLIVSETIHRLDANPYQHRKQVAFTSKF